MSGDELDGDRARRAAQQADDPLSAALGDGDLERAFAQVRHEEALEVLGALVRLVAGLVGAEQLRGLDMAADVDTDPDDDDGGSESPNGERPPSDDNDDDAAAVDDDRLPADPWQSSGDAASNMLEAAGGLFEALAEQRTVPDLMRAVSALDESEAFAIVLEQALRQMAERRRPSGGR